MTAVRTPDNKSFLECKAKFNTYITIFFFKLAGNYNAFAKWYNNHVVSRSCSKGRSKYLVETTLCRGFIEKNVPALSASTADSTSLSQALILPIFHYLQLVNTLYRQPNSIAYAKMSNHSIQKKMSSNSVQNKIAVKINKITGSTFWQK